MSSVSSSTDHAATAPPAPGLERLELRIERLQVTVRFTFAFHAREVRFERDDGSGYQRIFPETFSFHVTRHDPAELSLILDDLLRKPRLLAINANRRDSQELLLRLLTEVPRYLERVIDRIQFEGRLDQAAQVRVHQDAAILAQVLLQFSESRDIGEVRSLRVAGFLMKKRVYQSALEIMNGRVDPEYLERYSRGEVDPFDPSDDPSISGVFHVLETGSPEVANRIIVRTAERAFYVWLDGVCLDEENEAFEKQDSPFADREHEVMRAISVSGHVQRCDDLVPFLRRPSRDCRRVLAKLETWFLRQYDIQHSSAIIQHAASLDQGRNRTKQILTRHSPRNYALVLLLMASPFLGAVFAYPMAPRFFDWACSLEVVAINAAALWFLAYRFCWQRDLTLFHASAPRILAGVIVGYLPVFLIDEVWDLAGRSILTLGTIAFVLGITTLLYIYVEVVGRLKDASVAFRRARGIFLLGVLEAFGVGVVMTSLVGDFMVSRNWSPTEVAVPIDILRGNLEPLIGELPRVVGVEPFYIFPSAVLIMTFLSFFIGIFLQLMWEDLPITEPL